MPIARHDPAAATFWRADVWSVVHVRPMERTHPRVTTIGRRDTPMLPTQDHSVVLPPLSLPDVDSAGDARSEGSPCSGVVFGVDGHACRTYIESDGSFLLTTPTSIDREEGHVHDAEFLFWTRAGAVYEGFGTYDTEGPWPESPTTFRGTARVTNAFDPRDGRSLVCTWVHPLGGQDTVVIRLS
jgi:hypothetical protein